LRICGLRFAALRRGFCATTLLAFISAPCAHPGSACQRLRAGSLTLAEFQHSMK
jgi:hypothetical protein